MGETVVTVEREIAAPPEELWAMVSDITRMGEWSPESTGGKWIGGTTGPAVGARFAGRNRNGWRRWQTSAKVVESEPGKAFAFDIVVGPVKVARWGYRFEPTPNGSRVEERWEDQRRGRLMSVLGHVASGVADRASHNRESMEQTLANLAEAAESAPAH